MDAHVRRNRDISGVFERTRFSFIGERVGPIVHVVLVVVSPGGSRRTEVHTYTVMAIIIRVYYLMKAKDRLG